VRRRVARIRCRPSDREHPGTVHTAPVPERNLPSRDDAAPHDGSPQMTRPAFELPLPRRTAPWLTVALCAFASSAALAQPYPSKPVRIVVGYEAGGPVDILARLLTPRLGEAFGQQFIVDNRPGASGMIGTEQVAKAAPDGHTLLMVAATFATNPSVFPKAPYDPERDFAPVALVARGGYVLVSHPSFPARSIKDLIAVAKSQPGAVNFASSGTASLPHLSGELFQEMAGVKMNHIPYKGGAPGTVAVLGGQVPLMFNNMLNAVPHVKAGKMRALGVTSPQRTAILPDVPTISEAGLKGYEVTGWYGLFAPAGTPREIVTRLNAEAGKIMKLPASAERLAGDGVVTVAESPETFATLVREERSKWARVVKRAGIKGE
jgi:tripartite-type tricarboxylate transporter receptor subunit TctC